MSNIIKRNESLSARLYKTALRILNPGKSPKSADDPFKHNIDKNRLGLWFAPIAVIATTGLMVTLQLNDHRPVGLRTVFDDVILTHLFSKAGLAVLPHLLFALVFYFIWRNSYNSFALRVNHGWINKLAGPRGTANLSTTLMLCCFPVLLLSSVDELTIAVSAFYLMAIVAMFSAFLFAMLYQSIVDEARSRAGYDSASPGTHHPFYSLDTTSFGWVATNFLTAMCLIGLLVLLSFQQDFHEGWIYVADDRTLAVGPKFSLAFGVEALYLSTLVVIGFFSGAFRTPAWVVRPDRNQEIAALNAALGGDDGNTQQAAVAGGVTTEAGTDQPYNAEMRILPLMQSARAIQSAAGAVLLYFASNDLIYSIAFLFLLMFSYVFNDIFDFLIGKDKVAHPDRPLPSGRLDVSVAKSAAASIAAAFLFTVSFLPSLQSQAFLAGGIATSAAYSLYLKRWLPSLATPIWGAMIVLVFLSATGAEPVYYPMCFAFFLGRELLLDIRDEHADKDFAILPSLATLLGGMAKPVAVALMIAPLGLLATFSNSYQWLVAALVAIFICVVFTFYRNNKRLEFITKSGYLFVLISQFA